MEQETVNARLLAALRLPDAPPTDWAVWSCDDWEALLETARRHLVAPLLCSRFQEAGLDAQMPKAIWERWQQAYQESAADNMARYMELTRLLMVLQKEGIPVLLLKGAHLAIGVYGHLALRKMSDLDLLLHREDLPDVEQALMGIGHQPWENNDYLVAESGHLVYSAPGKRVRFELHWNLELPDSAFCVDVDGLWRRARPITVGWAQALILAPEDLLLHLAIHNAAHHDFTNFGIRPLCDIQEVLRRYNGEIDWAMTCQRAHEWRAAKYLYFMLTLSQQLLGIEVPEEAMLHLRPANADPRFIQWACRRMLALEKESTDSDYNLLVDVWAARGWRARTGYVLKAILPNRARMYELYGPRTSSWLLPFYYPRRWFDLTRRRARALWGLFRGEPRIVAWADREAGWTALRQWLDDNQKSSQGKQSAAREP